MITAFGKYWRLNYRFLGKQKTFSLGVYPDVSLAVARKGREHARELLAAGTDPRAAKQEAKKRAREATAGLVRSRSRDWLATTANTRGEETQKRVVSWFERDVFPFIGNAPIVDLRASDILALMKRKRSPFLASTACSCSHDCAP
jgi:hypothetical protein